MEKRTYNTTEKRIWEISDLWGVILYGLVIILEIVIICSLAILFFSQTATKPSDFPDLSHEVVYNKTLTLPEVYDISTANVYSKGYLVSLIARKAYEAGLSPEKMLSIARCESQFDHLAINKDSSSRGLFQIIKSTQKEVEAKTDKKYDVFDPVENIEMSVWLYKKYGDKPWNASKGCWNK